MPEGTPVYRLAHALERKGMPVGKSIAIAQKKTGLAYQTGKPPKRKKKKAKSKGGDKSCC